MIPKESFDHFSARSETETGMSSSYVLKRTRDGKFTFTLQTHYGKILLTSHAYKDKDSALRAISTARRLAHREENY